MSDPTSGTTDAPEPPPRFHLDLTAFDRARPYVSRVLAAFVGAGARYAATRFGLVELADPATVDALAFLVAMVVYGLLHKALDSRINQTDAARPTVAKVTQDSPIGSASEGVQTLAALAAEPRPLVADHDEGEG